MQQQYPLNSNKSFSDNLVMIFDNLDFAYHAVKSQLKQKATTIDKVFSRITIERLQ